MPATGTAAYTRPFYQIIYTLLKQHAGIYRCHVQLVEGFTLRHCNPITFLELPLSYIVDVNVSMTVGKIIDGWLFSWRFSIYYKRQRVSRILSRCVKLYCLTRLEWSVGYLPSIISVFLIVMEEYIYVEIAFKLALITQMDKEKSNTTNIYKYLNLVNI